MVKLTFNIGYPACELIFDEIEEALEIATVVLDKHVPIEGREELVLELKKCAGSGNSEMAHTE